MIMAPVLLLMYRRLAKVEEKAMIETSGEEYLKYREEVPAFIPIKKRRGSA